MLHKFTVLCGGLVVCLLGAVSSVHAVTVNAFGLPHTSIGNATLTPTTDGLVVGNLGSSGQDGVSVDLSSVQFPGQSFFSWDAFLADIGPYVDGSYVQSTSRGIGNSGTDEVLHTVRGTQIASNDFLIEADLSAVSNGQPMTIEYRSGGPNGSLVWLEDFTGTLPQMRASASPRTYYIDLDFYPARFSAGVDWGGGSGALLSARGVLLPDTLGIDFVDILAPTNIALQYSTVSLTAGGVDNNSFTLTGEVVTTPEPSTLALLGVGVVGLMIGVLRRRR